MRLVDTSGWIDITYHKGVMRTLVDVGNTQIRELDALSREEKRSRAALIREAVDDYLASRRKKHEGDSFGLWGKRKVDGLIYQRKVRSEW